MFTCRVGKSTIGVYYIIYIIIFMCQWSSYVTRFAQVNLRLIHFEKIRMHYPNTPVPFYYIIRTSKYHHPSSILFLKPDSSIADVWIQNYASCNSLPPAHDAHIFIFYTYSVSVNSLRPLRNGNLEILEKSNPPFAP